MKSESRKPGKMKIMSPDKSELMEISSIYQDAGNLVISGKIMGSLPMKAVIRPQDARNGLGLLNLKLILFLSTFMFRR